MIGKDIHEAARECGREQGLEIGCFVADGFERGIYWFKKHIWHPNTEEPVPQSDNESHVDCLVETSWGFGVRCWNPYEKCWDDEDGDDYDCDMKSVKRWTYLDDLLPKKGGEK